MKTVTTIKEAADLVREYIQFPGTRYFDLEVDNRVFQIRVSDHSGRSLNNAHKDYDDCFSFITEWNRQDINMKNEWKIDKDGDFEEEFLNIEQCLDWNIF